MFITRHLFVTRLSKTLSLRWLTWSELHSQSSHLKLLSKMFSSRSYLKFRGVQWYDRNGIYLTHTEVISDAILVVHPLRGALTKNAHTFGYFDGTNPINHWKRYPVTVSYPDYGSCASQNLLAVETFNEMKKNFASRNASIKIRNEVYDSILSG